MYESLRNYIRRTVEISDSELAEVISFFKPVSVNRGEFLLAQGQPGQFTYFVNKGCLRIFYINEDGQESTRYLAFENHLATALVSFVSGEVSNEYIQSLEAGELLCISHRDFNELRKKYVAWEKFYTRYLEKAYTNTVSRFFSFTTLDATERYRHLLNKNPEVVKRLPNKIVASYLNISQETLSRIKSKI